MTSYAADQAIGPQNRYLRELGLPTVLGAIVLLGSAALLLFANISALHANLAAMERSQTVLMHLSALERSILGEEMTVRGLALTGDLRFTQFQKKERAQIDTAWKALLRLSAQDPGSAADYRQTSDDIATHDEIFAKLAVPGAENAQGVAHAILDKSVRANMKAVRDDIASLRTAEMKHLFERQQQMTAQITRAFFLALGIIVAAFVLGGIGIWAARLQSPLGKSGSGEASKA